MAKKAQSVDASLIRREGPRFAQDLEPFGGRLIERVHHKMQICGQGSHARYFLLFRAYGIGLSNTQINLGLYDLPTNSAKSGVM
jgi:hypothetical protein